MNKKPSERIKEIYSSAFNDDDGYIIDDGLCNEPPEDVIDSILDYLDEEAEKPKYACPNCHRVVDELISNEVSYDSDCIVVNNERKQVTFYIKYYCKHCLNKN